MLNYDELKKVMRKEGCTEEEIKQQIKDLMESEEEWAMEEQKEQEEQYSIICPKCGKKAMPFMDTNAPEELQPMIYGHKCEKCGWIE
ncbi:hypothetical protein CPAST_c25890 [Clostridium pasteurianum DSM 525 = ATCC 6013]|uniref:Uncharacterized protein n=1 Tax=Clostridium pasteurianum DSM 525 = ATCC 6013 TaxID=1262449 RepID=A0A0H3J9D6_CLOPA|nr:hypothetical protein [Clostridium pasteurianum]AJA48658.1 hypothetical protein CPAST_c25890 [Clostridium pasteurianum DSM 525 = ATCC 6013]AJA52646.1 hypothetical protein CLPA_c25890 [Clostridium pasteurianum DSM 525 = ATCC 6013]AOZ75886.1 hypothetical protein AQ983_12585 [Clostridium pasteurianum DSM 525 = ATCC 6013]AOZ79682.1 hypothetical protein AQ984_12580 [Clostridium pasteurianum]ELP59958.1 hypothetical protein F502_04962 [Clostridium pasteurianum DSM 525 = ATCC 6013]